jgi:Sugar kinases, ribokinase family
MHRVICFGEVMLRLTPPDYERFIQAQSFGVKYGGTEANVAVSLSCFDEGAAFVTCLPQNPIADACISDLRKYGVDTSNIVRGGERVGIYYLERGSSVRPSKVVYDRKHSSFSESQTGDYNYDSIFKGADWFHFTGITAALGENVVDLLKEACIYAKSKGITVSCDINYRSGLWSCEKASQVMSGLMEYVDLAIIGEDDAEKVFGIKPTEDGYRGMAETFSKMFNIKKVAIAERDNEPAPDNTVYGFYYTGGGFYESKKYVLKIVDQVGGGDAFAAGIIYSELNGYTPQECVEFAAAAASLKHTIEGDANLMRADEVKNLINSTGIQVTQR